MQVTIEEKTGNATETETVIIRYGRRGIIRADREKAGKPIGSMDMLIGAHVLALGATLVTNNTKEFKQIKNLKIVDWSL